MTFEYHRSEAVERRHTPVGFFGLLLADLADKHTYFVAVEGDDPFFRVLELKVDVPVDSAPIGLTSTHVAIDYGSPPIRRTTSTRT